MTNLNTIWRKLTYQCPDLLLIELEHQPPPEGLREVPVQKVKNILTVLWIDILWDL